MNSDQQANVCFKTLCWEQGWSPRLQLLPQTATLTPPARTGAAFRQKGHQ